MAHSDSHKPNPTKAAMEAKLCDQAKKYLNKDVDPQAAKDWQDGIGGSQLPEGLPTFIELPCEDVWKGQNNTYIVLGRDRPSNSTSGFNATTQAGAIDIVVGRMGSGVVACSVPIRESGGQELDSATAQEAARRYPIVGQKTVYVHPMFSDDAARIYISQKSDVDENFNLVAGKIGYVGSGVGPPAPGGYEVGGGVKTMDWGPAACVAIKSDDVRIIARRGIKLVTMGPGSEKTSQSDHAISSVAGINIIAGNKDDGDFFNLQPIIKGNNLVSCLETMLKTINQLSGIVGAFLTFQQTFNKEIAAHTHIGMDGKTIIPGNHVLEFVAGPNTASALLMHCQEGLENWKKNAGSLQLDTLKPSSPKYICSRWNYVN